MASIQANLVPNLSFNHFQTPSSYVVGVGVLQCRVGFSKSRRRRVPSQFCIKCCEKKDEDYLEHVSVERPPYYSYMDSTSGQLEPASGARSSLPEEDLWPEGTVNQVRAGRAPAPIGESSGTPSYGSKPGSRRKKNRTTSVSASGDGSSSEAVAELTDPGMPEASVETFEDDSQDSSSSEYVVYQPEPVEEEASEFDLDRKLGVPHAFVNPKVKKPIEGTLTSEELWWNWRKPEKEQWSRWQRRRPDVETVFLKAMAETGQVKLYGEEPTLTECALYRARRHLYKEERLQVEQERLERVGPMAYYSEWVKVWKGDTSREAIQKHFEDTGEDENTQLIEMFSHQTAEEYRIMMGTDLRIPRDPLAMRMKEDQIKQIWGGDPVYPTVNYIQDPDVVIDFRGADFHEPTPDMLAYLKEHGKIISREELEKILAKEKNEQVELTDMDEAMAKAVDIGENDDEEESELDEEEGEGDGEESESEEKVSRKWSVLKTTPQPPRKSKAKPKKDGPMSLEEAVDDSENLTDFLLDFEEEE